MTSVVTRVLLLIQAVFCHGVLVLMRMVPGGFTISSKMAVNQPSGRSTVNKSDKGAYY